MTTRVEDLKPEALVQGLVGREAVFIVTAEMLGDAACKVVYRGHDGAPGEQLLFRSLGARRLRDDLNHFLRVEKPHVRVRDLVDWCRKYLYLPRVSTDQAILHALINPSAALSGESTFHLADGFDEASGRYCGLRTQQASSTQPTSLTGYFVKEEVALAQIEADRTKPVDPAPPGPSGGEERAHRSRTRMKERGHRGLVGLHHRLRPHRPFNPKPSCPRVPWPL